MRIVIDMQGAQTESRFRGIGRYTLAFTQAIVRNRREHEIILVLNGLFPETIEPIRFSFKDLLPQENIRVWNATGPVKAEQVGNENRLEIAELIYESFLASLQPDVIHVCSLFEGYVDDAVISFKHLNQNTPLSIILYDLIPYVNPEVYLKPNSQYADFYQKKIEQLNSASRLFAISDFTRHEGLENLSFNDTEIINISTAIDSHFQSIEISKQDELLIKKKFNIHNNFILYSGGADQRKNLDRLLQAYAALPLKFRNQYQLVLAGKMPDENIIQLKTCAHTAGLEPTEFGFTGYISDEELIQLYNLCHIFIFPSWHEGFGLPALEAMACGAAVIASNISSIPEVVGLDEALFDPFDTTSITEKLMQALEDKTFYTKLKNHALKQAKKFSWDSTAKQAIKTWETIAATTKIDYIDQSLRYNNLLKIIAHNNLNQLSKNEILSLCISLEQNQGNSIERQLFIDISELCQRDAATGVQRVVRNYLYWLLKNPPKNFRIEPVYATPHQTYHYARVYTQHLLKQEVTHAVVDTPIRWQRGDIFFGLDMQHHVQLAHKDFFDYLMYDGVIVKFLIYDLLPIQLPDFFKDSELSALHHNLLKLITNCHGAICISQATADAFSEWITKNNLSKRYKNAQLSSVHIGADIDLDHSLAELPFEDTQTLNKIKQCPSFLCVSTIEPRKGQQQLFSAIQILWEKNIEINLVLVGQAGWKTENFINQLLTHPEQGKRLFWLKGINDNYLEQVYNSCTCLVATSINEGFGLPLIEAAHYKLPIIARDIPVFREVAGDCAFYFNGNTAPELADSLTAWLELYKTNQHPKSDHLQWSTWQESTEKLKLALIQEAYPRKQIFVDISELVRHDTRTGIQRVVRSILWELLTNPPSGYSIEPIYATTEHDYRYAYQFTQRFLNRETTNESIKDEVISYFPGDLFLGLDFQPQIVPAQRLFYKALRQQGIEVTFVIYDLLSLQLPQYFLPGNLEGFTQWLEVVTENNKAICISQSVADELKELIATNNLHCAPHFVIESFHLGADASYATPTETLPEQAEQVLENLRKKPSFLMVGTLEPRKGYAQTLTAFEQIWEKGIDTNLVIVGKQGWMVEEFAQYIHSHPHFNKQLFWLEGINDAYLKVLYTSCTCLIAASYGEGFGLPLIEAAQHNLPIIARDIPVFREVAREYAYYFDAISPNGLSMAIENWLKLFSSSQHPKSEDIPWLTWQESAKQIVQIFLKNNSITYL